ncbi:DNA cytosine methyltransferase [Pseudomonas jessenii]|uniref:DNA cytosine methyltransferase n=1 Tax=Pseudomonas jessenii TaxID=77298 RepID=UPI0038929292
MSVDNIKCEKQNSEPLAIDFFSGSGSVSAALKKAGFRVAAALDIDPNAAVTYQLNHPEVKFFNEDIRHVNPQILLNELDGKCLELMAICAPCQPFSSQNRKRDKRDSRIPLLLEALPFIEAMRPKYIWVENVPGLGSSKTIVSLQKRIKSLGYSFNEPARIDAANLGVPQRRIRFVFFAALDVGGCEAFETVSNLKLDGKDVRFAFNGLKNLSANDGSSADPLHTARKHSDLTLKRLSAIPVDGGSRSSLPPELQLACHKKLSDNSFPDVYGRMRWSSPAPTLTSGCTDVTRGRFAHPEENRAITLREAARLQTFPDDYQFHGNKSQIALQIGNAVPMDMAYEMFSRIIKFNEGFVS